jgi:hypothetical protein
MAAERLDSKEKILLRHPSPMISVLFFAILFFIAVGIVIDAATSSSVSDRDMAIIVVGIQALYFVAVLLILWLFNNIAKITNKKIIKIRIFPWEQNEEISLLEIEDFNPIGWQLIVVGGGHQIRFFCPPFLASRIIAMLREKVGPDFDKRNSGNSTPIK